MKDEKREAELKELSRQVAHEVMGMVECDKWAPISFGMAGGMVLEKKCKHPEEFCYSKTTVGNINAPTGTIGGPPPFAFTMRAAWNVVLRMTLAPYTTPFAKWWDKTPLYVFNEEGAAEEICKGALEIVRAVGIHPR